jgi:2-polyprenyl-3-methyl-5-hydroxy-6-metoxy-1,4-benzoquinol methylase
MKVSRAAMPTPDFSDVTEQPGQSATRMQMSMLETRYRWAAEHASGKDVLEVACGAGLGLGWLAERARRVEAGDIDAENCHIAQETYRGQSKVRVQRMDALDLPFEAGSFDVVLLFEALYYLPDVPRFLAEARRVLRPGGTLLLSTVNCELTGFHPSPLHIKYWTAAELLEVLEGAGFEVRIFAGFRENDRLRMWLRGTATRCGFIPRTMRGKAVLKRTFYGRLERIPRRLEAATAASGSTILVDRSADLTRYRNLYFEGRRAA